jgi:ribonuclease VapC
MIAVDTSALIAIVMGEPEGKRCFSALSEADHLLMSAATMAETLIVAARRDRTSEITRLLDGLNFDIINVTPTSVRDVVKAYDQWGKGVHPAALNFGDCFAYAIAKANDCPLLFIGNDFSKTDIQSAIIP